MVGDWVDLRTKGFVVVERFFSEMECQVLKDDYERPDANRAENGNYNVKLAAPEFLARFESKLKIVARATQFSTGIDADVTSGGMYFATERGINFSWHQDHESYFMYQDHYNYLNFYIPFVKPDKYRTNVSLIPFDLLRERAPSHWDKLVGGGATEFQVQQGRTRVSNHEDDSEFVIPVNLDELAVTPCLSAGDLLLFRGDVIHRTQDTETERIALSIRRQKAASIVDKQRLINGGATKQAMMLANKEIYRLIFQQFAQNKTDQLTVGDINAHLAAAFGR
jgi:hypothetical protein